ncbi:tyrosine-type recombinase/integrase [Pasteurella skyensis]|uniref:Tyrosine-type recombinase/integrase n=1 Tax=Phocoenobacter skyensis TaxID=97481 RepID=A0AAJ6NAM6_9PAST|nr:integrase arm-type DNA-binding domain-containing protein [Pasteurella skyensis]MDP8173166.1 tyrosine-type recombinase/integrase [Pasteurella skyensis]MDP8176388.1 tyrosine-type recombinase/integrase [Pasteurella skyensis]MDP8178901.1 tyrosine-type recombinase/integrase [Pasteurella skyensis]MDP8199099.1 tyrosine-type recombinase/integrase [Pasteurella skyensis]
MSKLTAIQVKNAKPKEKLYKLSDGGGLFLWVYPTGNKNWVLSIQKNGKRKDIRKPFLSMTLAEARAWREEVRTRLAKGEPMDGKIGTTFEIVFYEWFERWRETVIQKNADQLKSAIEINVFPTLAKIDVAQIRPVDIVESLKGMEERGVLEYLQRTKSGIKRALDYAVARGLIDMNPAVSVSSKAFKKHESQHLRALAPSQLSLLIGGVERGLKTGKITPKTYYLIYWQLLTWSRPTQAVQAEWKEINAKQKTWTVPADKMKKRRDFIVPLSPLLFEILNRMKEMNLYSKYIFESDSSVNEHMSRGTVNKAMKRLGIDTTAHGFRSLARTTMGETLQYDEKILKRCLSHKVDTDTDLAYDRSKHIEERRPVISHWSEIVANERAKHLGF